MMHTNNQIIKHKVGLLNLAYFGKLAYSDLSNKRQ